MAAWLAAQRGLVAELARDELADIIRLTPVINALERQLAARIRTVAPSLLAVYGCGALSAPRIIGETADVNRFKSEALDARTMRRERRSCAGLIGRPRRFSMKQLTVLRGR